MKQNKLVIYGIGETAEIAYEYFTYDSDYEVVAFTVDKEYIGTTESLYGIPVIAFEEIEKKFSPENHSMYAASTYNKLNRVRTLMYNKAKGKNYRMANYISSKAFVWRNVTLGDNVFIFENNVLQHNVKIGNNVMLWSGNHIGHRTVIKDHVYLSSHCVISGFCEIGEFSFLGVNCTFNDNIKIGKNNIIGSGALIVKNTEDNQLMIGSPAKPSAKSSFEAFNVDEQWQKIG
jgi:sugar O-acyltransferase (sialic acid O-acetyltransferase NeuD family)